MTAEDDRAKAADALVSKALALFLEPAAAAGSHKAKLLVAVADAEWSRGRPAIDDDEDLAAIRSGKRLSVVARRRADASGKRFDSVRRRLTRKIRTKDFCPTPPSARTAGMAKAPPTVTARELQAALARKVTDLEQRDREALARQIVLEKGGAHPVERPEPMPHIERAKELLNGSGYLLAGTADAPGTELWELIDLRKAIKVALDVLQKEEVRIGSLSLAEWMANGGMDRWLAHRRRLADALLAVKAEISEGAAIRSEATNAAGGTGVSLPSDRGDRPLLSPHGVLTLEVIQREVLQ